MNSDNELRIEELSNGNNKSYLYPTPDHDQKWQEAKNCKCIGYYCWWPFFWLSKCMFDFRFYSFKDICTKSINIWLYIGSNVPRKTEIYIGQMPCLWIRNNGVTNYKVHFIFSGLAAKLLCLCTYLKAFKKDSDFEDTLGIL